jgi:hypothetical protein
LRRSETDELWLLGLQWLREANGTATHPCDRKRVILLARGMRMLGEEPPMTNVTEAIRDLWSVGGRWSDGRPAARMTKECWRNVYRAKSSLGRSRMWDAPLYQPDCLIEKHGLEPSTEERIAAVAGRAVQDLCDAAWLPSSDGYVDAQRRVADALATVRHLRYLRLGPQSLGIRGFESEPPRRPMPAATEVAGTRTGTQDD